MKDRKPIELRGLNALWNLVSQAIPRRTRTTDSLPPLHLHAALRAVS